MFLIAVAISVVYAAPTSGFATNHFPSIFGSIHEAASTVEQCNYMIFTDGITTYVQDCASGALIQSGEDASAEINAAIATLSKGGLIHVKAGTYELTAPISSNLNGIVFEGEGLSTVFSVREGFQASIIQARGSNWVLRHFKIDASNQVRLHRFAGIYISGNNETIMDVYASGTDHAGIDGVPYGCGGECGYGIRIMNNTITNGYDDGIIVRGSNVIVENNVIDTTLNHNGISLVSPRNVTVVDNSIEDTDNGIALENLGQGYGPAEFITITGNVIRRSRFFGFWIYSGDGDSGDSVTFTGNMILNPLTGGIELDSGYHNLVDNNTVAYSSGRGIFILGIAEYVTVVGNTLIAPKQNGICAYTDFTNGLIQNNTIINPTGTGILLLENNQVTVSGNKVYNPNSDGIQVSMGNDLIIRSNLVSISGTNRTGIDILDANHFAVVDNNITYSIAEMYEQTAGIRASNSTAGVIAWNSITGLVASGILLHNEVGTTVAGNTVTNAGTCILEDTSNSDYNTISNNNLVGCGVPLSYLGAHDVVTNNMGPNQGSLAPTNETWTIVQYWSWQDTIVTITASAVVVCIAVAAFKQTKKPMHRKRRSKKRKNRSYSK